MSDSTTTTATPATNPAPARRGPGSRQLAIVVVILAVGIAVTALTSNVTQVSEPGIQLVDDHPFLPPTMGQWKGGEQSGLTKDEQAALPADTGCARRVYTDGAGHSVYCAVVLAGHDVTSIHRPELCLTGQGWKLEQSTTEVVDTPAAAGGQLKVARMNAINNIQTPQGTTQAYAVFVYWFVGKDRTTPHHWQRILWTTMDRIFHSRNHRWAYFLINVLAPNTPQTARDPKVAEDEAMQTVKQFIQDIYPQVAVH